MTQPDAGMRRGWRTLDPHARIQILIGLSFLMGTLVVWAVADTRALAIYPLLLIVSGLCYE